MRLSYSSHEEEPDLLVCALCSEREPNEFVSSTSVSVNSELSTRMLYRSAWRARLAIAHSLYSLVQSGIGGLARVGWRCAAQVRCGGAEQVGVAAQHVETARESRGDVCGDGRAQQLLHPATHDR